MKESAANVAASAKSGMEKTKANVQEKVLYYFIFLTIWFILGILFAYFLGFFCFWNWQVYCLIIVSCVIVYEFQTRVL